jgi:HlyD family secretion protein
MKKTFLYIIIAIAILGTAGYFLLWNSGSKDIKYRTENVTRGNIVVQVRATGTINPVQTVQVGSQVSGIIEKIYVDYNDEVKKNQIIARIDSTFLNASVKEAQANLERNLAQANDAKRTLARSQELFKKNLVSQADLDAATTTHESAQAQLKQTQAALDRAMVNLRYAVIRAPIDGVVISRDVDVGQTVAASLQTPKLFSIGNDLKQMRVEASVDEADIGQIKSGESVTFTVDAYPDEQFRGSVTQVRLAPVSVQNVVTYTVIIDVPNPDLKLRPGMTATVSILIDKRENALRVPTMALKFQPPTEISDKMKDQKADTTVRQEQPERHMQSEESRRQGGGNEMRGSTQRQGTGGGQRQWGGERRDKSESKMARIWVLDANKNLKQITIKTGLNDTRYIEVLSGDLKEDDDVIIGILSSETASAGTQQTNPFAPRMPGGGGGGGGRRGM